MSSHGWEMINGLKELRAQGLTLNEAAAEWRRVHALPVTVEAQYIDVRPGAPIARTVELADWLFVDVDASDLIVGVEALGEHGPSEILFTLATRLRVSGLVEEN